MIGILFRRVRRERPIWLTGTTPGNPDWHDEPPGGYQQEDADRAADPTVVVREFHAAFGFHIGHYGDVPPDDIRRHRATLITEEAAELAAELLAGHPDRHAIYVDLARLFADRAIPPDRDPDPARVAHETGDLTYVTAGAAVNWGSPLPVVVAEIHAANMRRLGPDGRPLIVDGKARKPAGWQPADVAGAVARHLGTEASR